MLPDGRLYEPGVFYCKDVFEGLAAMDALCGPAGERDALIGGVRRDIEAQRQAPSTAPALRAMVRYAVEKRLGARGLRGILEEVLADALFEAPERRGDRVVVDRAYVESRLSKLDSAALKE